MRLLILLFSTIVMLSPAHASTVVPMDFNEVTATAELIFEGRVLEVEARQTGPRAIHTHVRFEIIEVLKGDYPDREIELTYLGGRVGNQQMQITDMQVPEPGETGFYFVESLQRNLVHPLVGWQQGHYRIERDDDGEARVQTASGRRIASLTTRPDADRPPVLSHGGEAAGGVQLQALGAPASDGGLSAAEFRRQVSELVSAEASQ